jgi:hypothetical protein
MQARPIGIPSQIVAIAWMGCSALCDGLLSGVLIWQFLKARRSFQWSKVAKRFISLTLETVLLTHVVGAVMCVIFLASPPQHRTKNNLFWILLEIITELYALSILFTILHHEAVRAALEDGVHEIGVNGGRSSLQQTDLDRRVEGLPLSVITPLSEDSLAHGMPKVSYFGGDDYLDTHGKQSL